MSIITSRLDNDFYNFTMGYVVWRHYPKVQVEYRFTNRTIDVPLADWLDLDRLREEVEDIRTLGFQPSELEYLRQTGLFDEAYLAYLERAKLPEVEFDNFAGQLRLGYRGSWADAILWETPLLSLVNQLYYEAVLAKGQVRLEDVLVEGEKRLSQTVATLMNNPTVRLIELGSRRRFSRDWQARVVGQLAGCLPEQVVGTSNVWLAKQLGIPASGTMAHQMFMVTAALHVGSGATSPLVTAQNEVLDYWEEEYENRRNVRLLVALTDTFGTDFFLRHFEHERASRWHGLRQDSGNPAQRCQQMLNFYRSNGIEPSEHVLVPSDGLNTVKMVDLTNRFGSQTQVSHGCGTFLTNNLGLRPLSIVIKPTRANGQPAVKLSDNIAKAMGDPAAVELYKELSAYETTYNEACVS